MNYKDIFQGFFDEFVEMGMDETEAGLKAFEKM